MPAVIISLFETIYTRNIMRLMLDTGKIIDKMLVNCGTRQKDTLNPLLFNVIINEIIRIILSQCKE